MFLLNFGNTQGLTEKKFFDDISAVENNTTLSANKKLEQFYTLKNNFDKYKFRHDSIYSKILLKIAAYEILVNKNYVASISCINNSIQINRSAKPGSSVFFAAKSYFNLANNYYQLTLFDKALNYFDSAIILSNSFPDTTVFISYSKLYKANIFFRKGDYQKAIEESTEGIDYSIKKKDSLNYLEFLNQRAQSLYFENELSESLRDLERITKIAKNKQNMYGLASALKIKAMIFQKEKKNLAAELLFKQTISYRIQTGNYQQIALDYIDYGNFYLDSLHDYQKAKTCYIKTLTYAQKQNDSSIIAIANTNIGELYLKQKNYQASAEYCIKALKYLNIFINNDICRNPTSDQLNAIGVKELALVLMTNKAETLSKLFLQTGNKKYLLSCLKTALVMDTLITKMRNMQSGTESKLYWRNFTRDFYTTALEACSLSGNTNLAFYFMEKSRAVLLNDKLNELGASSFLSVTDAAKQDNYQIKITELEQKLSALNDSSKQYQTIQLQLLNAKSDFEQFIKSLEQKYPAYYQYKYADSVPTLQQLQSYLEKNNQSFVHYFLGDTMSYILAITSASAKLVRLSQKDFNKEQLSQFLQLCANKEALMNNYTIFAAISNSIYKEIFHQLQIPKGRIVICSDNMVIPFEALCTDATGKHFLLNDYSFSYVYSARFLMKQFSNTTADKNFLGFAPVSFASYLSVQPLQYAADALRTSAHYYKSNELFVHETATRRNFFKYTSSYSIVNIFSHARADTTDNEPVLYMQDSLIHLSELQLLKKPSTQLVLLSACQTNVGKNATGEGIYSLARGFASAGIPSVAATLWKADEQTIYKISEKFNQYLAQGMDKDEALQKAKLFFIQNNSGDKLLPFYWANMIVIGNTDAIKLSTTGNSSLWWIAGCIALISAVALITLRKKLFRKNN